MAARYFFDMIQLLRRNGEVVLYDNVFTISPEERSRTSAFLEKEYQRECLNYPFQPPPYHAEAALWGAEMIYVAAQLLLYRQDAETVLGDLLPKENLERTASAVLSADLCLRFLPGIVANLRQIDQNDPLIVRLEAVLERWHYSGIEISHPNETNQSQHSIEGKSSLKTNVPNPKASALEDLLDNQCLYQLYINRIIKFKNTELAAIPQLNRGIQAAIGMHGEQYWPEFKPLSIP